MSAFFCISGTLLFYVISERYTCLNAGLGSEQLAIIDFIVLSQGQTFVGMGLSSFSFYLREYRSMMGCMPLSTVLIDRQKGKEGNIWVDLFAKAAKVL